MKILCPFSFAAGTVLDRGAFQKFKMRMEFENAVRTHQSAFGVELNEPTLSRLADYYDAVLAANTLLHLVAQCSAEEFAVRHILESLALLKHLPTDARFADVGAGAGLPSIPCLVAREDLKAVLIESKEKKSKFLLETAETLDLGRRAKVVNRQFEEVVTKAFDFVTCRALDKFSEKLPRLLKWSGRRTILLFGGPNLHEKLKFLHVHFSQELMPMSEQRYLFVVDQSEAVSEKRVS